jgi:uncharacterized protein YndB with AHSA1/START domain
MVEIVHEIKISAAPQEVYDALTTLDGVRSWHTPLAEGTGAVGSTWAFKFTGRAEFDWQVVASDINERVQWKCTKGPGDSVGTTATFVLSHTGDGRTKVHLTHSGWPGTHGNYTKCNTIWGQLLHFLQQYVETGVPTTTFN